MSPFSWRRCIRHRCQSMNFCCSALISGSVKFLVYVPFLIMRKIPTSSIFIQDGQFLQDYTEILCSTTYFILLKLGFLMCIIPWSCTRPLLSHYLDISLLIDIFIVISQLVCDYIAPQKTKGLKFASKTSSLTLLFFNFSSCCVSHPTWALDHFLSRCQVISVEFTLMFNNSSLNWLIQLSWTRSWNSSVCDSL